MDNSGEARRLLDALAQCYDELRSFGNDLYIQHRRIGWDHSFVVSGTPFTFSSAGEEDVYQRCFITSTQLKISNSILIVFSIYFCWDAEFYMACADLCLSDADQDDENYSTYLWDYSAGKTRNADEAITLLHIVTQKVIDYGKTEDFSYLFKQE